MLEATTLPIDLMAIPKEPMLMPTNFSDMWWVVSTTMSLVLLAMVVYFLKRMVDKLDSVGETVAHGQIRQEGTDVMLNMHVRDPAAHCKGERCLAMDRRHTPT